MRKGASEDYVPGPSGFLTPQDAAALLGAAPQVKLLAPVRCTVDVAPKLLKKEAPFERLRMSRLSLIDTLQSSTESAMAALGNVLGLQVGQLPPPPPVHECIAPLAAALRESTSLTWLDVDAMVTIRSVAALAALVEALTSHLSLRVLRLTLSEGTLNNCDNNFERDDVALRALCALVEADAPALRELHLVDEALGDELLAPLIDALARNTHLRALNFGAKSNISQALAAERLLPAVRAASSLRVLGLGEGGGGGAALQEAQAMLRARVDADANA